MTVFRTNHTIISVDAERKIWQVHDKNTQQTRSRTSSAWQRASIKKPVANIILNGERQPKAFPLRSRIRESWSFSTLLFTIVLEVLARANRQEKEIKDIQIEKEVELFADNMILYIENAKVATKK